jgi:hypothetical protein
MLLELFIDCAVIFLFAIPIGVALFHMIFLIDMLVDSGVMVSQ